MVGVTDRKKKKKNEDDSNQKTLFLNPWKDGYTSCIQTLVGDNSNNNSNNNNNGTTTVTDRDNAVIENVVVLFEEEEESVNNDSDNDEPVRKLLEDQEEENAINLLVTIGSVLPQLKSVAVRMSILGFLSALSSSSSSSSMALPIPLRALTSLLLSSEHGSHRLEELELHGLRFGGSNDDDIDLECSGFCEALRIHPALSRFYMIGCGFGRPHHLDQIRSILHQRQQGNNNNNNIVRMKRLLLLENYIFSSQTQQGTGTTTRTETSSSSSSCFSLFGGWWRSISGCHADFCCGGDYYQA